ncbi:conserved hypothetical protein [Desulfatibacillum aliphaticivorans]|uniref:Uncharacterized protein n=1 Tax=Desulfatibacillum aliphaticivorans TaxID=218208 RepID=B8FM85_DESAL|nr:UPF0158 family protein [Desulfatibacillum aliphaticivorans]ACL05923.1 conserved hypothetical protein [Desulfatibacillum aliphaticivorans]
MAAKASLKAIIDEMSMSFDEATSYLEKETGKVFMVSDEAFSLVKDGDDPPDWQEEEVELGKKVLENGESFIELPDKYEINEYGMMEDFIDSLEDERVAEDLSDAIGGKGAFRRFKDGIHHHGVQEDWYKFKDQALKKIAMDWCESEDIEYIDDCKD